MKKTLTWYIPVLVPVFSQFATSNGLSYLKKCLEIRTTETHWQFVLFSDHWTGEEGRSIGQDEDWCYRGLRTTERTLHPLPVSPGELAVNQRKVLWVSGRCLEEMWQCKIVIKHWFHQYLEAPIFVDLENFSFTFKDT